MFIFDAPRFKILLWWKDHRGQAEIARVRKGGTEAAHCKPRGRVHVIQKERLGGPSIPLSFALRHIKRT
jgi:hypothetical protein